MQTPGTESTFVAHIEPPGTGPTLTAAYIQPPGTEFSPPARMLPGKGFLSRAYMQLSGSTFPIYIQPLGKGLPLAAYSLTGIGPTPAAYTTLVGHTQPSPGYAYSVNHPLSGNNPQAVIITTSISHGKELSNLAKIYTNQAKYNGRNNSFTFKLAIFHDICSRADVPLNAKTKTFLLCLKAWL